MKNILKPTAAAVALMLMAGPAAAVTYNLCAGSMTKSLPDGSSVTMWGYAFGGAIDGVCNNDPIFPGPRLTAPAGDMTLSINLTNTLPEPTSIVIPGLLMPTPLGPTWKDGNTGSRTSDNQRVRSFGLEAAAEGGTQSYNFAVDRPGTFVYHSGTHPQKQVYMGLYGAATKDEVAEDIATSTSAEAYPGVPYDNEVILFYSDIDPAHNAAVAAGDSTYTPIEYNAKWFLINGEPYEAGVTADILAGLASDPTVDNSRSNTLIRFLSAASETHVPVLQGLRMSIHAEDGLQYNWQDGSTVPTTAAPRTQYSAMLPPLKTKDAIIAPTSPGRYAVYDGNGYMTNPSNIDDFAVGDTVGGMLRFLEVGVANVAPLAVNDGDVDLGQDEITTPEDTSIDINVIANDIDPDGDQLTIIAVTNGTIGTVTISDPDCCVLYTPNSNANGLDEFTYTITDSNGVTSTATAMVDVTVEAVNDTPVAADDDYGTDEDVPLVVAAPGVLANDSDVDGDALTAVIQTGPANGTLALAADGSFTYTPAADYNGGDSFTYVANDGTVNSNVATVSITINPVNDAPVAVDDIDTTVYPDAVGVDVLANDSDVEGDTLSISDFDETSAAGGTVDCIDSICTYTPGIAFSGDDTFSYTVSDGILTDTATVTVTVNEPPVVLYLSLLGNGSLAGLGPNGTDLAYADEDILSWNGYYYQMVFDGSVAGIPGNRDIFGFDIDNNRILLAFNAAGSVGGVAFDDSDIVAYDRTTGSFTLFFDGSDAWLGAGNNAESLDAFKLLTDGRLLVSTQGNFTVNAGALSGKDKDLIAFTATSLGATTSGSWELYFDGSDVGFGTNGEDINATSIANNGDIYLSTLNNFTVGGGALSGQDEDVFICTPSSLGTNTACTFSPFFDGTANGLGGVDEINAIDLP